MPSPRRLFLVVLFIPVLFLGLLFLLSRPTVDLFSTSHTSTLPDEIFGLLHFVTSPDEANRLIITPGSENTAQQRGGVVAPEKPVEMAWYALGSITQTAAHGWEERLSVLRQDYPLVVFSKSTCPYSKRAKRLLDMYDLLPAPKIIEVDLRADASHIKTVLTRLTGRSTFPNVVLHGRSLGGSDELVRLHEEDQLGQVLEKDGIRVRWKGSQDMVL